ncbi:MAG: hypothetical protein AAFW73_22705 [Bacteroidota bacterium]
MFKNFFRRNRRQAPAERTPAPRNLFEELFPLTPSQREQLEVRVADRYRELYGEEGYAKLRQYAGQYQKQIVDFHALRVDTLGWEMSQQNDRFRVYTSPYGDTLRLDLEVPTGPLEAGTLAADLAAYRNRIRGILAGQLGGLISCELLVQEGVEAYETIGKIPRQERMGVDYLYHLDLRHYGEQRLYQVMVRVHEGEPTGSRDNLLMQPLSELAGMDLVQLMAHYRRDPYAPYFAEGNRRNLAELEVFDALFPIHPLSIIRREIRPRILADLRWDGEGA